MTNPLGISNVQHYVQHTGNFTGELDLLDQ